MKQTLHILIFFLYWKTEINCQSITLKCLSFYKCSLAQDRFGYCTNLNLTVVPACVENLEFFDLTGNFYQRISQSDFPDNFHILEVLILRDSQVKVINEDAFNNLHHLRELDLSENLLRSISCLTFSNNELLERLNLSTNRIRRLDANQFASPKLRMLDLSNGFIEFVDDDAFSKVPALEWLNLRDNKLKTFQLEINVQTLLIGGSNPWNCDCGFLLLSKKVNELIERDFSCLDLERGRHSSSDISDCEPKEVILKASKKIEKLSKSESNSPELILDVYGYVLLGITILVFLCCCLVANSNNVEIPNQTVTNV